MVMMTVMQMGIGEVSFSHSAKRIYLRVPLLLENDKHAAVL